MSSVCAYRPGIFDFRSGRQCNQWCKNYPSVENTLSVKTTPGQIGGFIRGGLLRHDMVALICIIMACVVAMVTVQNRDNDTHKGNPPQDGPTTEQVNALSGTKHAAEAWKGLRWFIAKMRNALDEVDTKTAEAVAARVAVALMTTVNLWGDMMAGVTGGKVPKPARQLTTIRINADGTVKGDTSGLLNTVHDYIDNVQAVFDMAGMLADEADEALEAVECGVCGASGDEPCVTASGKPTKAPHKARN